MNKARTLRITHSRMLILSLTNRGLKRRPRESSRPRALLLGQRSRLASPAATASSSPLRNKKSARISTITRLLTLHSTASVNSRPWITHSQAHSNICTNVAALKPHRLRHLNPNECTDKTKSQTHLPFSRRGNPKYLSSPQPSLITTLSRTGRPQWVANRR